MPIFESPTSTIPGRSKRGNFVTRLFGFGKSESGSGKASSKRISSNAEYHLTLDQINNLISSAGDLRNRLILKVFAFTGIRRFELAALKIEDLHWNTMTIHIKRGKGNKARYIPIPRTIVSDLTDYIADRKSGQLFLSRFNKPISVRQLNRIAQLIGESAGIENPNPNQNNITCHLFRHSFARLWKNAGGDIESLSRILGHSSVKTTWDLYGTQSIEDVKSNYKKTFENLIGGEGGRK